MGDQTESLLMTAIEASDRTTQAVRAIALFLFYSFGGSVLAGLCFWIEFSSGESTFFGMAGVFIGVVGVLFGFISGTGALAESRAKPWRLKIEQEAAWKAAGSPSLDNWHDQPFDQWLANQAKPESQTE